MDILSSSFGQLLLLLPAVVLSLPVIVLFVEIFSAAFLRRRSFKSASPGERPRAGVIVPAHNESAQMVPTLLDIRSQLSSDDRLIVVADNCSDDTAEVARHLSVDVIERHDLSRIGKGYALDYGLRHLSADRTDVVIFIDADCRVGDRAIDLLAREVAMTQGPVQALDLMTAPEGAGLTYQISEFAWRVKNWVRPLGLRNLGLPCQLVGTGMAIPFDLVKSVDLATGALAEDLKLGLDLAAAGHAPSFCPDAVITSHFAISSKGRNTQQTRWEQGHLSLIASTLRRSLLPCLQRRDFNAGILILDLSVPPLMLLLTVLIGFLVLSGAAGFMGSSLLPFYIALGSLLLFAANLLVAWRYFGQDVLEPRATLALPSLAVTKILMYTRILFGRGASTWLRTDRHDNL